MLEATSTDFILRAQNGDPAVISSLYERYHPLIFRFLFYRVGDRQTAEDLTSEVFVRMLRFLTNYRPQNASFQAWLVQIARNLAIDHYRSMNHRNHLELDDDIVHSREDLKGNVEHVLTSETLKQAMQNLTEEQRDVIILRFVSGLSIAQAAQALHKSEDAIKALQRRGLIALREVLIDWEISYV